MTHILSQGKALDTTSLDILQSGVASTVLATCPRPAHAAQAPTHATSAAPAFAAVKALNLIQPDSPPWACLIATLKIQIWFASLPIAALGLLCRALRLSLPAIPRRGPWASHTNCFDTPRRGELLQPPHLDGGNLRQSSGITHFASLPVRSRPVPPEPRPVSNILVPSCVSPSIGAFSSLPTRNHPFVTFKMSIKSVPSPPFCPISSGTPRLHTLFLSESPNPLSYSTLCSRPATIIHPPSGMIYPLVLVKQHLAILSLSPRPHGSLPGHPPASEHHGPEPTSRSLPL